LEQPFDFAEFSGGIIVSALLSPTRKLIATNFMYNLKVAETLSFDYVK
jgi:hypothetical protein